MPNPRSLKILRLTLMRELETINQYQDFFEEALDPEVKGLMGHLMFEEKEHVAELTAMLRRFDTDQNAHFETGHALAIGSALGVPAPKGFPAGGSLTVGSLLSHPQ